MFDSENEFASFNQLLSPEPQVDNSNHLPLVQVSSTQEDTIVPEVMGILHKSKSTLQELLKS